MQYLQLRRAIKIAKNKYINREEQKSVAIYRNIYICMYTFVCSHKTCIPTNVLASLANNEITSL